MLNFPFPHPSGCVFASSRPCEESTSSMRCCLQFTNRVRTYRRPRHRHPNHLVATTSIKFNVGAMFFSLGRAFRGTRHVGNVFLSKFCLSTYPSGGNVRGERLARLAPQHVLLLLFQSELRNLDLKGLKSSLLKPISADCSPLTSITSLKRLPLLQHYVWSCVRTERRVAG